MGERWYSNPEVWGSNPGPVKGSLAINFETYQTQFDWYTTWFGEFCFDVPVIMPPVLSYPSVAACLAKYPGRNEDASNCGKSQSSK